MPTTIVFFSSLISSYQSICNVIVNAVERKDATAKHGLIVLVAISLWSWLYYLSH